MSVSYVPKTVSLCPFSPPKEKAFVAVSASSGWALGAERGVRAVNTCRVCASRASLCLSLTVTVASSRSRSQSVSLLNSDCGQFPLPLLTPWLPYPSVRGRGRGRGRHWVRAVAVLCAAGPCSAASGRSGLCGACTSPPHSCFNSFSNRLARVCQLKFHFTESATVFHCCFINTLCYFYFFSIFFRFTLFFFLVF